MTSPTADGDDGFPLLFAVFVFSVQLGFQNVHDEGTRFLQPARGFLDNHIRHRDRGERVRARAETVSVGGRQSVIFEQVFDKFIKSGLIRHDQNEEKLIYKIDSQGILDLVTDQVLRSKAKEIDGLNNVIKQKLASYRQANSQDQIDLVVNYLKNKDRIKQDNKAIYYSPFDNIKGNSSKVSQDDNKKSKDSATTYQRAIAQLKSRPAGTRPSKKSSLTNYLKSHLRNEDPKTIDKLVKQMVSNKIIVISNTNKLIYKI